MTSISPNSIKPQQGSILLVSLVLLTAISTLGISSMRSALLEERIAGDLQEAHLAIEAAESALRHGQRGVRNSTDLELDSVYYISHGENSTPPDLITWTNATSYQLSSADMDRSAGYGFDAAYESAYVYPRYKIEEFDANTPEDIGFSTSTTLAIHATSTVYYRIIARGVSGSGNNEVILESIISKRTR